MRKPVPVVGVDASGQATDVAMVPYQELDSFLSELSDDFEFGVGQMHVTGAKKYLGELGRLSAKLRIKPSASLKLGIAARPKLQASVKAGIYGRVTPHKQRPKSLGRPKKPAGKRVVQKHRRKGKRAAIIARPKPHRAAQGPVSVSAMYKQLKSHGKILNLMQAQREATAEHRSLESESAFRHGVMKRLKAIDKRICHSPKSGSSDAYRARWNKLKIATGAW